jgi:hypothetical protein
MAEGGVQFVGGTLPTDAYQARGHGRHKKIRELMKNDFWR